MNPVRQPSFFAGLFSGLLIAVATLALFCIASPRPAEAQSGVKWEYQYVEGKYEGGLYVYPPAEVLNQHGKNGWEAVGPLTNRMWILMKRRR